MSFFEVFTGVENCKRSLRFSNVRYGSLMYTQAVSSSLKILRLSRDLSESLKVSQTSEDLSGLVRFSQLSGDHAGCLGLRKVL